MEKIYLKEILDKHSINYGSSGDNTRAILLHTEALEAMKEVWSLAVDQCIKKQRVVYNEDGIPESVKRKKLHIEYLSEACDDVTIYTDKKSLEQVRQLIT
jgi:hypothetical protein